uniref:[histone H3]-lysine(4) N-methyltransferase n=1 Tax=Denticeps clupeoides TaxID=299321 RepID=A0AAY4ETM8_9TELE
MAAAGCGAATAAAVGGAGGMGAARGRFPGRPWSSRSRLRSEKRWQLGRSGTEPDDAPNAGPRPSCLVLALSEDQSHLRLLGIEASHRSLGEVGYSSSGSEEVRSRAAASPRPASKTRVSLRVCTISSAQHEKKVKESEKASEESTPENTEVTKLARRSRRRAATLVPEGGGAPNEPGDQGAGEPKPQSKKKKRKKKSHKERDKNRVPAAAELEAADVFKSDEDMGIPGLKLTRIRNPKSSSRKKRNKFVWTLTLVKGKSKSTPEQEPQNPIKDTNGDVASQTQVDCPLPEESVPVKGRQPAEDMGTKAKDHGGETEKSFSVSEEKVSDHSGGVAEVAQARPEEGTQTEPETKYKRKKLSSSTFHMKRLRLKPDDPSKAADVDLGHEGKDSGNDEPLSDFLEVERGKSKFVKNIKHFIMPVVSARSSRLIKTPKRFMDDAGMSVLPHPSFKWRALGPAGEEVYTLDKDLECEYETLLAKELQTLIDSDPSIDLISVQKKKKTHKFNKRTHSKLYKKFHQVPIKNRKKLLAAEPANALTLPADDAEKAALDEGLMVSTLGEPLSEAEKAKLKIEDLDRPGVVRKVCVRALNSMPLFDELGEDFEINADALLPEKSSLHRPRPSGANRRMFSLLRKAKVQLIKIDQQKQLKSSGVTRRRWKQKYAGNVSPDKTESLQAQRGGPRIKHVCRAAAVVLGQPRATVPDDVPRLSALPLHERTGISPSPTAPGEKLLHLLYPSTSVMSGLISLANRNRRCGECKGCLHEEDCGKCINCLDKPKFGGPNTKRQCCVYVATAMVLMNSPDSFITIYFCHSKRRRTFSIGYSSNEEGDGPDGIGRLSPSQAGDSPSLRKQPRRCVKPRSYCDLLDYDSDLDIMGGSNSTSPGRRRIPGPRNAGKWGDFPRAAGILSRLQPAGCFYWVPAWFHSYSPFFLQEDCNLQNVWQMGGMSILTSVPLMPEQVCLLCASKGQHQMLHCQVCSEPFHQFCLEPAERPTEENKENWCCRRCKFCHVCGRKNKQSKPLLECERCQNCYHPSCLGPNYPKPNKRKKTWVCMTCIRCRSCGVTPGKSWDTDWNHDKGLCPDCTKLYDQGNYCTICFKCYEDSDYDSQMMQCATCNHWVHAKCEGLTDDLYEILSSLPESVVYSCQPCNQHSHCKKPEEDDGAAWRELLQLELRAGVEKVLACLLSSTLSQHLVTCGEVSMCNTPTGMLSHAVMPPTNEHVYAQWRKLGRPCKADLDTMWTKDDERQCALCQKYGDAKSSEAGRLLYLGQNEWAHVNCSMWSAEVFEEDNGSLMHVHSAVARGRLMRCERCNRTGATVGCCLTSCQSNYHFMCARSRNCVFQDDKRVFCYKHRDLISGKMITGQGFEVLRRVYVDFEGISLRRKFLTGLEPESINLMIGSLEVSKLGKLSELSTCQGKLYPVGYECSRWFWSTVNPLYRSKYTCRVREVRPTVQEKPVEELPDQGDNRTIAHSPCPQSELLGLGLPLPNPPREASTTSLFAKPDPGARPKLAQTRRPAGGMSRPLPSPGAAPSKSHHILTISDLDDTHRPRRHSPHTQNTGTRKHMASPPLGTSSGPIALRAGGSMHTKSSQPSSPHFPLGATENLLTTSSVRSTARSASTTRCAGTIVPHSTSGLFPQPQWSGGISSPPSSLSPTIHHSPRPRLPFDLNQSDSEVPHNFRSLDVTVKNGTSPLRDSAGPQKGGHLVSEQKFSYTPFHMDTDLAVGSELKTELEIEETLLNEGVAMNCSAQIDVEGEDNQEDFWDRGLDGGKCKASEHTVPCAGSSKEDWGNTSSDEDMENYFDFSRTVVAHKAPRDPKAPTSPSLRPIPQLDGVDDGTESDGSMANADAQNFKNTCVQNPAQQLEVTTGRTSNGLNMDSVNLGCDALSVGRQTGHSARDSFQIRHENFHITKSDVLVFSGNLKSLNAPLYQETNLDLPSDTPLILERCDSPSPSACFTDLVPVQDNVLPNEDLTKDSFLDPDSGYFVSSIDGSTVYPNHLSETMDISLSGAVNGSPVAEIDMLQPTAPVPLMSTGSVTCMSINVPSSTGNYGRASVTVYPTHSQPLVSTVSLVASSPSITTQTSNQCQPIHSILQQTPTSVVINGYTSTPAQKETVMGRTISINFSTPRPAMEPQQMVSQPLPGHAILTVKEVGGPNIDPTPHVLLVNRLGQIFVKNPESNTFQLPSPNTPSYNCVTQIASLLQSNALSATLATAGKLCAESAQAIINQAMAEPEPAATPPSAMSRPRSQVRMKRVSSFTDRVVPKKCKLDFMEYELPNEPEEPRRICLSGGVRIKTPTVKGILDLEKLNEDRNSDSENTRYVLIQTWDVGRHSMTDWNKYSDDELPPSDSEEEAPPSREHPHLRFEITSDDGFSVEADSIEVAWRAVLDRVQEARAAWHLKQLAFVGMSGARMAGMLHDAIVYLVEQLEGAQRCQRHNFRFHKQATQEDDLPVNPSGCARTELYVRKSTFDMFNFLASQHRQLPDDGPYDEEEDEVPLKSTRRATSLELPMAMRFRHLEKTSKEAVGVYRSAIHGRGLFCKRNIDAGEMVIEYSGIVIRSVLTDKREKYYDGKGIGCYMFRIDDFDVVDATMHGNAARFINHSCEPNCYSRVINVEGQKHIVIFALRKIYRGEELTYDYKFPIEDESNKLGCNCGARRCRRFLN